MESRVVPARILVRDEPFVPIRDLDKSDKIKFAVQRHYRGGYAAGADPARSRCGRWILRVGYSVLQRFFIAIELWVQRIERERSDLAGNPGQKFSIKQNARYHHRLAAGILDASSRRAGKYVLFR